MFFAFNKHILRIWPVFQGYPRQRGVPGSVRPCCSGAVKQPKENKSKEAVETNKGKLHKIQKEALDNNPGLKKYKEDYIADILRQQTEDVGLSAGDEHTRGTGAKLIVIIAEGGFTEMIYLLFYR